MKRILLLAILMGSAGRFFAQAGSPDPTFGGGDGIVTTTFVPNRYNSATSVAVQPDGKIVVAGFIHGGGIQQQIIAISRYLPNGTPDNTFSGDGQLLVQDGSLGSSANCIQILPNGKILFAGSVYSSNSNALALFRYNANGTPDNTFGGDGEVTTSVGNLEQVALDLKVQPDGKIVMAGYVQNPATGRLDFAVLRYNANGTLDNSFSGDGIVTTPVGDDKAIANGLLIQPDGKIVATGFCTQNGWRKYAALRFNTDGTPDPGFSGDGVAIVSVTDWSDAAYGSALQPDGKIILVGYSGYNPNSSTEQNFTAIRLTASGNPDHFFGENGIAKISLSTGPETANDVVIQPDGKIVLGGSAFTNNDGSPLADFALARLSADGMPDNSFGGDGKVILTVSSANSDEINALALQPDGKIVAAGYSRPNGSEWNRFTVARFLTGLSVDTDTPDGSVQNIFLYPNPVREQATLEYELKDRTRTTVNLYDLQGRLLQNLLTPADNTAGQHRETLHFNNSLPAGTYWLRIESAGGQAGIKVVIAN